MDNDLQGLSCPYCGGSSSKVEATRKLRGGIRRRRRCLNLTCDHPFTTYEEVSRFHFSVEKRSGRVEEFDVDKLRNSIRVAFAKDVSEDQVDEVYHEVYQRITSSRTSTIPSKQIGRIVVSILKSRAMDGDEPADAAYKVACLRFSSVFLLKERPKEFWRVIGQLTPEPE